MSSESDTDSKSNGEAGSLVDIDLRDATNVVEVHGSVMREKSEPLTGGGMVPLWVLSIVAPVLILGSGVLWSASGGFDMNRIYAMDNYEPEPRPGEAGAAAKKEYTPELWIAEGKRVYTGCAACHQGNGGGLPNVAPPLAGSEWVTGGTEQLAAIILKAVGGPIMVNGQEWNLVMGYNGEMALNDKELAQVMSYIRNDWGNEGSLVTPAMAKEARAKYKSVPGPLDAAKLAEIGAEAMLPGDEIDPDNEETWVHFNP